MTKKLDASELVRAAREPDLHRDIAPAGYRLRGVSTLRINERGEQQWVKTERVRAPDVEMLEAFKAAITDAKTPRTARVKEPSRRAVDADLLTVYPWGDPHFGMLSWPAETGDDYNLQLARDYHIQAMDRLISLAPASEHALLLELGDLFHADNFDSRTTRGSHILSTDSRYPKMLRVGVWTVIECIKRLLAKHRKVAVIMLKGNHDDQSAVMLALCLEAHFHDNPRVKIDAAPSMYHYLEFGEVLLGAVHGHTVKHKDLGEIMAVDQREAWGRTKYRYWYTGHIHHETKKELRGVIVESFRTLAAKDAWHTEQGYRSGRSMVCDVIHRKYGRKLRHEVGIEELVTP